MTDLRKNIPYNLSYTTRQVVKYSSTVESLSILLIDDTRGEKSTWI